MTDATFADGAERPLRLKAETPEDLAVIATLAQDAVCKLADAAYLGRRRRFVALLNRFRWEDKSRAEAERRPFERVRAVLEIDNALAVRARGLDLTDRTAVLDLLDIAFAPGADGTGTLTLTLAGGAVIEIDAEALEVTLSDASKPYIARHAPDHEEAQE